MQKTIVNILLGQLLCLLPAGCSLFSPHYAKTNSLENRVGIHLIDLNDGSYSVKAIQRNGGRQDFLWEIDSQIKQNKPCQIKYHSSYDTNRFMVVEGKVENTGRKYPIVLDTGASQSIFVKDSHVLDNKLPIYPLQDIKPEILNAKIGLCHLANLKIGNISLINQPCLYLEQPMGFKWFGLTAVKDDAIILGLPALREFKYIVFDNVNKKVEFSYNKLFKPLNLPFEKQRQRWVQYPISIEEDFYGNAFLFVEIPILGEKTELQLDTGSGRGLAVAEELWEKISRKIQGVKLSKAKVLYPYMGQLRCKRGIIKKFQLGKKIVRNAKISVFPNNSPVVSESQGVLGMQYFQDTVMVLDFENELMWLRIHKFDSSDSISI